MAENFNSFVDDWITPISGTWTLFAGAAAILAPVIFKIYKKWKKSVYVKSSTEAKKDHSLLFNLSSSSVSFIFLNQLLEL